MLAQHTERASASRRVRRWSLKTVAEALQTFELSEDLIYRNSLQHSLIAKPRMPGGRQALSLSRESGNVQFHFAVSSKEKGNDCRIRVLLRELTITQMLAELPNAQKVLFEGEVDKSYLSPGMANALKSSRYCPSTAELSTSEKITMAVLDFTGQPLRSMRENGLDATSALLTAHALALGVEQLVLHGVLPTNLSPDTVLWHSSHQQFVFTGLGQALHVKSSAPWLPKHGPGRNTDYLKAVHAEANRVPLSWLLEHGIIARNGELPSRFAPEVREAHAAATGVDSASLASVPSQLGKNLAYQLGRLLLFIATGVELGNEKPHGSKLGPEPAGAGASAGAVGQVAVETSLQAGRERPEASTKAAGSMATAAQGPIADLKRAPKKVQRLIDGLLRTDPHKRTNVLEATAFLGSIIKTELWVDPKPPLFRSSSFAHDAADPSIDVPKLESEPSSCPARIGPLDRLHRLCDKDTAPFRSPIPNPDLVVRPARPSSPVARGPSGVGVAKQAVTGTPSDASPVDWTAAASPGHRGPPSSGAGGLIEHMPGGGSGRPTAIHSAETAAAPGVARGASVLSDSTAEGPADAGTGIRFDLQLVAATSTIPRTRSGSLPLQAELQALRASRRVQDSGPYTALGIPPGTALDEHVRMHSGARKLGSTIDDRNEEVPSGGSSLPDSPRISIGSPKHTPRQPPMTPKTSFTRSDGGPTPIGGQLHRKSSWELEGGRAIDAAERIEEEEDEEDGDDRSVRGVPPPDHSDGHAQSTQRDADDSSRHVATIWSSLSSDGQTEDPAGGARAAASPSSDGTDQLASTTRPTVDAGAAQSSTVPDWACSGLHRDHPQASAIRDILGGFGGGVRPGDLQAKEQQGVVSAGVGCPLEAAKDGWPRLPTLVFEETDAGYPGLDSADGRASHGTSGYGGLSVSAEAWAPVGRRAVNRASQASIASMLGREVQSTVDTGSPVVSHEGDISPTPRAHSPESILRNHSSGSRHSSASRHMSPRVVLQHASVVDEVRHSQRRTQRRGSFFQAPLRQAPASRAGPSSPLRAQRGSGSSIGSASASRTADLGSGLRHGQAPSGGSAGNPSMRSIDQQRRTAPAGREPPSRLAPINPAREISIGGGSSAGAQDRAGQPSQSGSSIPRARTGPDGPLSARGSHGGPGGPLPAQGSHGGPGGPLPVQGSHGGPGGPLSARGSHGAGSIQRQSADSIPSPSSRGILSHRCPPAEQQSPVNPEARSSMDVPVSRLGEDRADSAAGPSHAVLVQLGRGNRAEAEASAEEWRVAAESSEAPASSCVLPDAVLAQLLPWRVDSEAGNRSEDDEDPSHSSRPGCT